jgi:hypothetical protein
MEGALTDGCPSRKSHEVQFAPHGKTVRAAPLK